MRWTGCAGICLCVIVGSVSDPGPDMVLDPNPDPGCSGIRIQYGSGSKFFFYRKVRIFLIKCWFLKPLAKDIQAPEEVSSPIENIFSFFTYFWRQNPNPEHSL